ncbi:MAG: amino acid permease [Candidatus Marinimicrobia bacterium]|nr:amino acid permease [Candidatus Neomarinimicrobiota bacterium]MBL7046854.1 amino acid permease [Candidatus Neomarinimicrobiota bacterium]
MQATESASRLPRMIGVKTATAYVIANMIGTGIFMTSGIVASQLPDSGWVILCWIIGGIIALAGALCYGELATRIPQNGGEYLYLSRLFHPSVGFLSGWTSLVVGFSAPIAASSVACVLYLMASMGMESIAATGTTLLNVQKGMAILLIVTFTGIHYAGHRVGSFAQNILTGAKVMLIVGLAAAGLISGTGDGSSISFGTSYTGEVAWGTAILLVMFAYSGWNASSYIAGELRNPRFSIPVSLFTGTIIVIILYVAVNLFIFRSAPYSELQGVLTIVEVATRKVFGDWAGDFLSVIVGVGLLSSVSAFIMIGPRVYSAMAQNGQFLRWVADVHPRFKVPGKSLILQGVLASIMVAIGTFEQLLVYLGFALSIFPALAVAGLFLARRRHIGDDTAVGTWGYPATPLLFLVSMVVLMVVAFMNRPFESTCAIITVALGIPVYWLFVHEPKRAID